MSPIEPRFGEKFQKALKNLALPIPGQDLMEAMVSAANNRYPQFERLGTVMFGTLDSESNFEWVDHRRK